MVLTTRSYKNTVIGTGGNIKQKQAITICFSIIYFVFTLTSKMEENS